jgi:hypothetical protein
MMPSLSRSVENCVYKVLKENCKYLALNVNFDFFVVTQGGS